MAELGDGLRFFFLRSLALRSPCESIVAWMHQANREAVFAWLDACNRKRKAELLRNYHDFNSALEIVLRIEYNKLCI